MCLSLKHNEDEDDNDNNNDKELVEQLHHCISEILENTLLQFLDLDGWSGLFCYLVLGALGYNTTVRSISLTA